MFTFQHLSQKLCQSGQTLPLRAGDAVHPALQRDVLFMWGSLRLTPTNRLSGKFSWGPIFMKADLQKIQFNSVDLIVAMDIHTRASSISKLDN